MKAVPMVFAHNPLVIGLALLVASRAALGVHVYMMSSGDAATDNAAMLALTSRGHTVTLGVTYYAFDGSVPLAGVDTVYLQANFDWASGPMPAAGQQQLVTWVNGGGRLVTSEWVMYDSANGYFSGLAPILPTTYSSFTSSPTTTLTQSLQNNSISPGVPASFTIPLDNYAGTESITIAKNGASTYYTTNAGGIVTASPALAGWHVGSVNGAGGGYVYTFTSTCGPNQVADPNFGLLFSNTMAGITPPCEAAGDYNHDGAVATDADIEDFFACISGNCCAACDSADFNGDGAVATDADIEAFFRVLAGGGC
jgi:hypothetical protein